MTALSEKYFVSGNKFLFNGFSLDEIVKRYKAPFYLYSGELIENKYFEVKKSFPDFDIFYSFKANPNPKICKLLYDLGAGAEVSSLNELKLALKIGFDRRNIIFVGPGKSEEEIAASIEKQIHAIVAESSYELMMIEKIARSKNKHVNVMLRLNTIETPPDSKEIMVGKASKFGFDEEVVESEIEVSKYKNVRIIGIHVYPASQILDTRFIQKHIKKVAEVSSKLSHNLDFDLQTIDFGGGFGIPYESFQKSLDLSEISKFAKHVLNKSGLCKNECRFIFELGRFIVAEAGIYVAKIIRIKYSRGKNFIILDGGLNHLLRPVFMNAKHTIKILNKIDLESREQFDVCGRCCTPLDVFGENVALPSPKIGDIVGIFDVGAYGYSMSPLNFMSLPTPEEILVYKGKFSAGRKQSSRI
jgi:diaminopimelate decarboxylase